MAGFDSGSAGMGFCLMSSTPTCDVALTAVMEDYIRAQVVSGHYSSAREIVRAGLRLLIERDQVAARVQAAGRQVRLGR